MAEIAREFLIWLAGFGAAGMASLAALHLVMRRLRTTQSSQSASIEESRKSGRLTVLNRIAVVTLVAGIYVGLLGPVAGSVLDFLKSSGQSQEIGTGQTSIERDESGRPILVPVPDPISTVH